MISGSVTGIPSFLLYVKLKLYGTYWPLIIPAFCGGGIMNIFLVRQFLLASGVTLDEAAKIDGANTLQRMFYINFPIVFPILLYIAANAFLGVWNDYKGPLIYIQDEEMYTFALGLYQKFFTGSSDLDSKANVQMATCVLMSIIPMGLFVVFQNRIIGGVQLFGAVKG
jgi:multiple sugar transport system permease protein